MAATVPLLCFGVCPPKIIELWRFFWFVPRLCGLTSSHDAVPNMSLLPPPGGFKTLKKKKKLIFKTFIIGVLCYIIIVNYCDDLPCHWIKINVKNLNLYQNNNK